MEFIYLSLNHSQDPDYEWRYSIWKVSGGYIWKVHCSGIEVASTWNRFKSIMDAQSAAMKSLFEHIDNGVFRGNMEADNG